MSEACALAQRTLQIRVQSLGDTHPKTVASYTLYAQVLEASGTRQAGTVCSREAAAYPNRLRTAHPQQEAAITLQGTSHESLSRDDPLQRFLDLCCELHPLAWCRISELWHAYLVWTASAQKRVPLSRRAFTAQIKARGCRVDRTNSARIWRGIRLVKAHPASP